MRPLVARGLLFAGLAASAGAGWFVASSLPDGEPASLPDADSNTAAVVVQRADITGSLVLHGTVVASPSYVLSGVRGGVVRQPSTPPGPVVAAGEVVVTVGPEGLRVDTESTFERWLVVDGVDVPRSLPVAQLRLNSFGIRADVPAELQYRVGAGPSTATAVIDGGPGPFPCAVLQPLVMSSFDEAPAHGEPGDADPTPSLLCAVPPAEPMIAGASATVVAETVRAAGVLVVPVSAVIGTTEHGDVEVLHDDGTRERRTIALGITDGVVVEVVGGLSEGERVAAAAPSLSPEHR